MANIVFIDTEIDYKSKKILDIGGVKSDGQQLHSASVSDFSQFIQGSDYLCGHNIIRHDIPYIQQASDLDVLGIKAIDTLYLSPLLFPRNPYHALVKDEKLQCKGTVYS